MDLPDNAAKMIRDHIAVHGDPFEPYDAGGSSTETEIRCHGCSAVGIRRWPNWELELEHMSDCGWLAFRAAFTPT